MVDKIAIDEPYGRLPLEGNWRYRPFDISTFTLAPGESRIILDLRRHGWVIYGIVGLNNPDVKCTIELETGTENYVNSFTTSELFTAGLIQPQPTAWWLSRYDSTANLYGVSFTPSAWWPFYRRFKFTLENKTSLPATIVRAYVLCIEFMEGTNNV